MGRVFFLFGHLLFLELIQDPCSGGLLEIQKSKAAFEVRPVQAKCIFFLSHPILTCSSGAHKTCGPGLRTKPKMKSGRLRTRLCPASEQKHFTPKLACRSQARDKCPGYPNLCWRLQVPKNASAGQPVPSQDKREMSICILSKL